MLAHNFRKWLDRRNRVSIGGEEDPFFVRYRLVKTRWFSLYLHEFHRSDKTTCLHDHPWPFVAVVLRGGYWEEMPTRHGWSEHEIVVAETRLHWRRPGAILWRSAATAHRVSIDEGTRPWSLVLVGRKSRPWGFWTRAGWIPWTDRATDPICETD